MQLWLCLGEPHNNFQRANSRTLRHSMITFVYQRIRMVRDHICATGQSYNRYNCIAVDGGMADTACYFNSNTQAVNRRGAGRGVSG